MALRKIIYKGDPILRKKSREITEITERIRTLAEDMWETMYEANGVGLAAPQVGVLRRLVVIDLTPPPEAESADEDTASLSEIPKKDGEQEPLSEIPKKDGEQESASAIPAEREKAETGPTTAPEIQKYVLINPVILEVSEETVSAQEGCLSVPGMVGRVERPARIKVRARGLDGKTFELEGEGMLAKALFHEIDHLDGILYTDKAESVEDVELAEEAEAG